MNIQNYLLCILYMILIIVHIPTWCYKDYHRGLISVFSFALLAETIWTALVTVHYLSEQYGSDIWNVKQKLDLTSAANLQYNAQFIHIIAINFFILFLLIVAKGWPITRRKMPFKYAFAIFWLSCLTADLITFYWTTISEYLSPTPMSYLQVNNSSQSQHDSQIHNSTMTISNQILNGTLHEPSSLSHDNFNSTSHKLSLLLRIIIMIYFLLELRTTMILEQEKRKLQFYLHFGALTMVWLVHTLIVYIISLRVDESWRVELVAGCSAAATFIGFAVTTRLLWPRNSQSRLFRKGGNRPASMAEEYVTGSYEIDNYSTVNQDDVGLERNDFGGDRELSNDGLEMSNLDKLECSEQLQRSETEAKLINESNAR